VDWRGVRARRIKMNEKIGVLGCGRVGKLIAFELNQLGFDVTVADNSAENLATLGPTFDRHKTITINANDREKLLEFIKDKAFIVNALPGFLGFRVLEQLVQAGKRVIDISFFPEDPLELHHHAVKSGAQVIYDAGVAPGLSNLFVADCQFLLDEVRDVRIYVGGLPVERSLPWQYKAFFSPIDVLEEYTRPARIIRGGEIVTLAPLTETERLNFSGLGDLEAFMTDGLRSLLHTVRCDEMFEKTLRYPGHRDLIANLEEIGLFSTQEIQINQAKFRPIDFSAALFTQSWSAGPTEDDLTVMRIQVLGVKDGVDRSCHFELSDRGVSRYDFTSMARTTGYTAISLLTELRKGERVAGVFAPEQFLRDRAQFSTIVDQLTDRGIEIEICT